MPDGSQMQTMALLPGSPAIDAGSNALIPSGLTTDQRGLPRIMNGTVDIGAFEYHPLNADINGDGVVNAIDVQLVINAALGLDIGGLDADVNGDGTVNAIDVQLVINAALGL